jgi:predicted SnoaL-like aldol condensation-catalyzing enzyme
MDGEEHATPGQDGLLSGTIQRKEEENMSTEENKKIVLRWREERNKGNWNIIDELHAPDYVGHIASVPGGAIRGREALKQLFVGYLAAFDLHATPEPDLLFAEGDMVAHRETVRVKHKGAFQGIPPTGKEATFTSMDIYRIVDGKVVEQWVEADMLGLLQQLGILPTPGHGGR